MMSSLGYHTLEISLKLTADESLQLLEAFKLSKDVYILRSSDDCFSHYQSRSGYYNIYYRQERKGLSWTLRHRRESPEYMKPSPPFRTEDRCCTIKAKINPKILLGLDDYIVAANSSYLDRLASVFNQEAKAISPILADFGSYSLNRIDYCVNFDLRELELRVDVLPSDYMVLIKQSNIPNHFQEYTEYRETTHRKQPGLDSFYLTNNSVHINCYCKYPQLQREYPSVPGIDDALNVIRFEIQCLYWKTRSMKKRIKDCDDFENVIATLMSGEMCERIITSYFNKTIGKGDYYTLEEARKKIKSKHFNQNKEDRLLNTLKLVSLHHGIFKAKSHLKGNELEELKRSVKELGELGINPVTIPRERGIKFLPNLLRAYLTEREKAEKEMSEQHCNQQFPAFTQRRDTSCA